MNSYSVKLIGVFNVCTTNI